MGTHVKGRIGEERCQYEKSKADTGGERKARSILLKRKQPDRGELSKHLKANRRSLKNEFSKPNN